MLAIRAEAYRKQVSLRLELVEFRSPCSVPEPEESIPAAGGDRERSRVEGDSAYPTLVSGFDGPVLLRFHSAKVPRRQSAPRIATEELSGAERDISHPAVVVAQRRQFDRFLAGHVP